jgi:3-oxoacyl-(acyl-carrier-protein) synthase
MRRRVKITGIGPVTPAGIGREAFFKGINEPVSRVRNLDIQSGDAARFVGADIRDFDMKRFAPFETSRRLSRHSQLGLVGAVLALEDAGLTFEAVRKYTPMIVTGTSIMDIDKISRSVQAVTKKGSRFASPTLAYDSPVVTVSGKIAEYIGKPARMLVLQTACCSGLDAIGQAAELIAMGRTDLAIAGGSEAPLTFHPLVEFNAAELNPTEQDHPEKACRPFDLWRTTGVLGEGAAMLILEPEESPRAAYAWITGYGYSNDAGEIAASGMLESITDALANAGRRPDEVDYISTWGTGHKLIDSSESYSLKRIFGPRLAEIPASSIKGAIGIALGASGAIQSASVALSLQKGIIPPTVNWETPDPNCPLNLSNTPRFINASVAVINTHGVSGSNAALVIEKSCPP